MPIQTAFVIAPGRERLLNLVVYCVFTLLLVGATGCEKSGVPVTGEKTGATEGQSETSITTAFANKQHIVVVAYNDGTNSAQTIQYTDTTRKILPGASLMGWSYSLDEGQTWTYGGKVQPPAGWSVLWGDPASTTSDAAYSYVFMANLAIPNSKMPPGGIDGSVIVSGADSYIGGACIARSTNGGINFQSYQCVSNTTKNNVPNSEKGHFYDGGSMASSTQGDIYAAFVDITTNQIDVWRSPSINGQFAQLAPPFPNMSIYSHPRLRVNHADGALYVAAQAGNSAVYINRFANGQWGAPVAASNPGVIYPSIAFKSGLAVRTGPQFSFDIGGASDESGSDAVRVMYTDFDDEKKRFYVTGSYCSRTLSGCWPAPEWGTTPGNLNTPGDQFNPNVKAWAGFIGLPPIWKASYLDRDGAPNDAVTLRQGNLAYFPDGGRVFLPFAVMPDKPVCPDNRGYWGDYNDMAHLGFKDDVAQFIVALSDSSQGCDKRQQYDSHHLHVRSVVFP
jgi:hypothetical protein